MRVASRRVFHTCGAGAYLVVLLCIAAPSLADNNLQDGDRAAKAIELGDQGIALFEQGRWAEALERFQTAEATYHSPVFVLFSARCLRNSGRLLDAEREFRRLQEIHIAENAPAPWLDAQRDGRAELADLERQIPTLVVVVENASQHAVVTVDGKPVVAREPMRLDPGAHRVRVSDGAFVEAKTVTLEAAQQPLTVRVRVVANDARSSTTPTEADDPQSSTLAWTLIGTGAAATVAGGALGILTLGEADDIRSDIDEACAGRTCPKSREPGLEHDIGGVETQGTVAVALTSVGIAAAVVGLILLPSTEPSTALDTQGLLFRF